MTILTVYFEIGENAESFAVGAITNEMTDK